MTPTPPFAPQWTTPDQPGGGPVRPIGGRFGWVVAGIVLAVVGLLVANGIVLLSALVLLVVVPAGVVMHLGLFVLCLVAGLRMLSGGDRAMGLGLLIGWVLGAAGTAALVVWAYQSLLDH